MPLLEPPLDEVNVNDGRVLSDDRFTAQIQLKAWRPRSGKTMDDVIREACHLFRIAPLQLELRHPSRLLSQARAWIAHQCVEGRIASVSAVAHRFNRDESTLRQSITRYYLAHSN